MERMIFGYGIIDDDRNRYDDRDNGWKTINGTHVHFGENGKADKGGKFLTGKTAAKGKSKRKSKAEPADVEEEVFAPAEHKKTELCDPPTDRKQSNSSMKKIVGDYAKVQNKYADEYRKAYYNDMWGITSQIEDKLHDQEHKMWDETEKWYAGMKPGSTIKVPTGHFGKSKYAVKLWEDDKYMVGDDLSHMKEVIGNMQKHDIGLDRKWIMTSGKLSEMTIYSYDNSYTEKFNPTAPEVTEDTFQMPKRKYSS